MELKRKHTFKKWAPDLGENRELPESGRLYLQLATGLTAQQMQGIADDMRERREAIPALELEGKTGEEMRASAQSYFAAARAVYADALGDYVRVHEGPHKVDGQVLSTFADYVAIVATQADEGFASLRELEAALVQFNSVGGPDELFSLRRSGGVRTTRGAATP